MKLNIDFDKLKTHDVWIVDYMSLITQRKNIEIDYLKKSVILMRIMMGNNKREKRDRDTHMVDIAQLVER